LWGGPVWAAPGGGGLTVFAAGGHPAVAFAYH